MSDDRTEPQEPETDPELEEHDVPDTAGPVEQATPATGALGRPDLGANPFGR